MLDRPAEAAGDRYGHDRLRHDPCWKRRVRKTFRDELAFSQWFIAHILARSAQVEHDLVEQLFNSTEKRLARVLLLLANFGKAGRPEPILAEIKQDMLAEMVGTTRARVKHFMNKFKDLGFIEYNDRLAVHSSLLSVVLQDSVRPTKSAAMSS